MRFSFRATALLLAVAASACTDQLPTVAGAGAQRQTGTIAAPLTNPHVFLLPPLAPPQPFAGTFDATLAPEVQVMSGEQVVATLTAGDVKLDATGEFYHANWKPAKAAAGTYRVLIRAAGQTLDYFDVAVAKNGTLPIKFRIEQGAFALAFEPVGAAGGTVNGGAGDATVEIPAGALSGTTRVSVETVEPGPADARVVGEVYDFGPDGTTFASPVTITLKYDPQDLPAGVSDRLLRLHTFVNGQWQVIPGSTVNSTEHTVSGATSHFSSYAVLPAAFTSVSSGEMHACGLTSDGSAWCWGRNADGQLGAPTTTTCPITNTQTGVVTNVPCSTTAVQVQGGHLFQSMEAGNSHSCGVTFGGEAYCWGVNTTGQLGDGTTTSSAVPVHAAPNLTFAQVSVDNAQTCGLTTAGDVYCWGSNTNHQLGSTVATTCLIGTAQRPCSTTPVKVNVPAAQVVDVGLAHACALTTAGEMYCWGWNLFGQIGTGGATNADKPPTLVPGGPYESISAGAVHNCMTRAGGIGVCFGTDFMPDGALGDGTKTTRYAPTVIAGGITWAQVDASNGNYILTHTCGVSTSNVAYCWGGNFDGQLGVTSAPANCVTTSSFAPNFDCALTPNPVSGGLLFSFLTSSAGFVCGYTVTGDVYCWGKNIFGQLGDGTNNSSRTPVKVLTSGFAF
jgi:alpha-tubulin suppressor-like RCC1 family protein